MLATFAIEMGLAAYTFVRYPKGSFRMVVVLLLVCLASFQLAEYQVCEDAPAHLFTWTKMGLVGISLLPALGMHLIGTVTRRSALIPIGYGLAITYALIFLFVPGATMGADCMGNYVILRLSGGWRGRLYEFYYLGFVALSILELILRLTKTDRSGEKGFSRRLIGFTLFAFLSFTVPMAVTAIISAELRKATPSIMCGFAVLFALIVTFYVAPQYAIESGAMTERRLQRAARPAPS
jgi:hypothetical protein